MKQKKVTIKMNIGNPKYNVGDKVICPLAGEGVLTIAPGTFHNGFTWMYYFEENECGCGGEYISPAPAATPSPLPETEIKTGVINKDFLSEPMQGLIGGSNGEDLLAKEVNSQNDAMIKKVVELLSETEKGVSTDTPTEAEYWDLYPGNEAGAFDHLDAAPSPVEMLDKTPGNERQESGEGFTSGKWEIEAQNNDSWPDIPIWATRDIGGGTLQNECVATVWASDKTEETARLIASAPAMYRALKRILELTKDDVISQCGDFVDAKELLNSITGGK